MNTTNILVAAVLAGAAFTSSQASTNDSGSQSANAVPVPLKVVSPTEVPRRYVNDSVELSFILDEEGVPHHVESVGWMSYDLSSRLLPAVSQWRFSPCYVDGRPVRRRVILPLKLVEGELIGIAAPTEVAGTKEKNVESRPVPIKVVAPTQLPRQYANTTVRLSFILDEQGVPHDIQSEGAISSELAARLLPAISEWRFTPSQVDGRAVKRRVILPLILAEG